MLNSVIGSPSPTASQIDVILDELNVVREEFETVSKNLKSYNYAINYSGSDISDIVYTTDTSTITKTLNYIGGKLSTIVLSGDTPSGITLTKTLTYTGDNLTSISYS